MECRSFDEQVVRRDQAIDALMDRFVCVRLVKANGLDLAQFQFDFDLTFAVFLMNADGTVYGRYGTRSSAKYAEKDISLEGFRKTLAGALELHRDYPMNQRLLEAKRPSGPRFKSPEDFPSLAGKYKDALDYEGKVVQSCMHCHQLREAERLVYRESNEPFPMSVLYPWPMPDVVGLALDPREKARVRSVAKGSAAERAGFKPGDDILALQSQPIISTADVQWVLHSAGDAARIQAHVMRGKKRVELALELAPGWRRASDISWRATTWDLRRMATGGLLLKEMSEAERRKLGLTTADLSLRVEHVGQYGDHAAAKRAGFLKDDVIVELDGRRQHLTEGAFIVNLLESRRPGDKVPVTVLRGAERLSLELPMQ